MSVVVLPEEGEDSSATVSDDPDPTNPEGGHRKFSELHFPTPSPWDYKLKLVGVSAGYWFQLLALYATAVLVVTSATSQARIYCFFKDNSSFSLDHLYLITRICIGYLMFYPILTYMLAVGTAFEYICRQFAYYRLLQHGVILDFKNREGLLKMWKSRIFLTALASSIILAALVVAGDPWSVLPIVSILYGLFASLKSSRSFESSELVTLNKFIEPEEGENIHLTHNLETAAEMLASLEFMTEEDFKWHVVGCTLTKADFDWTTVGRLGLTKDWVRAREKVNKKRAGAWYRPYAYWGVRCAGKAAKDIAFNTGMRKCFNLCLFAAIALEFYGIYKVTNRNADGLEFLGENSFDQLNCATGEFVYPPSPPP